MDVDGVIINFLGHSGFLIETKGGKKIIIDPYNISTKVEKADYILITHSHYDHCSIKDIEIVSKKGTIIVVSPDAQSKITKIGDVELQIVEIGDNVDFGDFKLEVVRSYNIGKDFHPKSENWHGYIVKIGKVIIYHAGDCDNIPEMKNLTGYGKKGNEFVALLPVSGKYVMDYEEAFEVASILKPSLVIPMHYGSGVAGTKDDAIKFCDLCKEKGIRCEIMEKI